MTTTETASEQSGPPLSAIFAVKRLLDAALDVSNVRIDIFERDHPGALIALEAWATENGYEMQRLERDGGLHHHPYVVHRVEINARGHIIAVYL